MRNQLYELEVAIAKGVVPGHRIMTKFAERQAVGVVEVDIWDSQALNLVYLSAAETMFLASDDATDTNGGSGAWNVLVQGLDNDFNEIGEVVVLDGQTPVETVQEYIRVFRMSILTGGTDAQLNGILTCTASVSDTLQASIIDGNNQTLMSHFTVPAGHMAMITKVLTSSGEGKEVTLKARTRDTQTPNAVFRVGRSTIVFQGNMRDRDIAPVPEKYDIKVTAKSSAAGTKVDFTYRIILIEHAYLGASALNPDPTKVAG